MIIKSKQRLEVYEALSILQDARVYSLNMQMALIKLQTMPSAMSQEGLSEIKDIGDTIARLTKDLETIGERIQQ